MRCHISQNKLEAKKVELIAGLRDVRERILLLASSLPEQKRGEIYLGSWSAREMLAHLAGWDVTNLNAANKILAGELPSFYRHFDRDWATYNAMLIAEYGRDNFGELLGFVKETQESLLAFINDLPASELWQDRGIRARGWKVTIGRLLEAEKEDEQTHLEQLKQFSETGEKT